MSLDIYLKENVCPHCKRSEEVYSANYTHNIGKIAQIAGIYELLWHPVENAKAGDLINPILEALVDMNKYPEKYLPHNPTNGWGSLETFIPWLQKLCNASQLNPTAIVIASI